MPEEPPPYPYDTILEHPKSKTHIPLPSMTTTPAGDSASAHSARKKKIRKKTFAEKEDA
jgi:hypothetical protein